MEILKIRDWLANPKRKFEEGLKLYDLHKSKTDKDAFFRTQPTFPEGSLQYNILFSEMNRIYRILSQKLENNPKPQEAASEPKTPAINTKNKAISLGTPLTANQRRASVIKITNHTPSVDYNSLPLELQSKFNTIKELSKSMAVFKAIASDEKATDADRKTAASNLCQQFDYKKSLWAEIDQWAKLQEQQKKEELTPGDLSINDLKKEIKIRKDYINRALKNKTPKNAKKIEGRIQAWEFEMEQFQDLLNLKSA